MTQMQKKKQYVQFMKKVQVVFVLHQRSVPTVLHNLIFDVGWNSPT